MSADRTFGEETAPLRGRARIEFHDILLYRLGTLRHQQWSFVSFVLVCTLLASAVWSLFARATVAPRISGGTDALIIIGAGLSGFVLLAVIESLGLLRMGQDRRSVNYEVDEVKIVTRDAIGAELSLPWSNIRKAVFTRRLLLLQLAPRGWRFLLLRAFDESAVAQLRGIAAKQVKR